VPDLREAGPGSADAPVCGRLAPRRRAARRRPRARPRALRKRGLGSQLGPASPLWQAAWLVRGADTAHVHDCPVAAGSLGTSRALVNYSPRRTPCAQPMSGVCDDAARVSTGKLVPTVVMASARRLNLTDRVIQTSLDLRDVQLRARLGLKTNGYPTLVGVHRHRGNVLVFVCRARAGSPLTLLERHKQLLLMPADTSQFDRDRR